MGAIQRALAVIYPHQCLLCDAQVGAQGALCPACWSETPFLSGHNCDTCAAPLPGESDGVADQCDACLADAPPWEKGRAAFRYAGTGRRIVLKLKHGDRTDLARPAALWMAQAGTDVLSGAPLLIPVPIHWSRRIKRRYNQSAEIVGALAGQTRCPTLSDALRRVRSTRAQADMDRATRSENQIGSMEVTPGRRNEVSGRDILLVDDVVTTGATLVEACRVLHAAGARRISFLVLARAAPRP